MSEIRLRELQRQYDFQVKIYSDKICTQLEAMSETDMDMQATEFAFVPQEHDFTPKVAWTEDHDYDFTPEVAWDEAHDFDSTPEVAWDEAHDFDFMKNE